MLNAVNSVTVNFEWTTSTERLEHYIAYPEGIAGYMGYSPLLQHLPFSVNHATVVQNAQFSCV